MFNGRTPHKKTTVVEYPKDYKAVNLKYAKVRECLPYELLLTCDNGDGSCTCLSDVDLLFNQQRLDRMSLQALQARLDEQIRSGDTGLSELRKNISDADLQKFIKSRYIQSLSELRQWSNYLARSESGLVNSIKASLESEPVVNSTSPTGAAPAAE